MHAVCFRLVVTDNNKCTFLGRLPWDNFGSGKLSGRCLLYFFFLKALVHRQNQRWCCIRSLQISSKFWDGLHLMLGRGPGCKNMSRYLILGRGGVTRFMYVHEEKNSIITTDPSHIYYKIYYIFRSHGMPLFFSSKSMSKDMIIKMSCNEMAKEEKKK